jgi:hypothetical protein
VDEIFWVSAGTVKLPYRFMNAFDPAVDGNADWNWVSAGGTGVVEFDDMLPGTLP